MYKKEETPTIDKWNDGENKGLNFVVPLYNKARKLAVIKKILLYFHIYY
jgi:hypothetical protein